MKCIIYIVTALVVLTFCVWLFSRQSAKTLTPNVAPIISNTLPSQPVPQQQALTTNAFIRPDSIDEDHWNELMLTRQLALSQNQPVEFYARVIDQNNQPIEGAALRITLSRIDEKKFETTNFFSMQMGSEVVHVPLESVSDTNGFVKFNGITGTSLWIESLSKDGYLFTLPSIGSFLYQPNGQHRVGYAGMEDAFDPAKGYILHLQKIGSK